MSHFVRKKTAYKRKDTLVKALQKIGTVTGRSWVGHVESHTQATNLYGYQGDRREDLAEIIVRREHVGGSSNDIGFKLAKDGTYEAIISEYDQRNYNEDWLSKLAMGYAAETIRESAIEQGFTIEEEVETDQGLLITCSTPD